MRSPRRVIDVSGDGPNNAGALIDPIRQFLLAEGVTINGLPIALPRIGEADGFARYDPSRLQSYFERCVIGGPDAFAIAVTDAAMFVTAVRRKLVREISMNMDQVIYAAYTERSAPTVDCNMIGQLPGRWLERRGGTVDDNAFPSRINPRVHMSTRQYARLVDEWLEAIGLRPEEYPIPCVAPRPRLSTKRREICEPSKFCSVIPRSRTRSAIWASMLRILSNFGGN